MKMRITIEGPTGVGKTKVAQIIKEAIEANEFAREKLKLKQLYIKEGIPISYGDPIEHDGDILIVTRTCNDIV